MLRRPPSGRGIRFLTRSLSGRRILFIGFAFTVMADPVSSIAYAIESALRHLEGNLGDLFLTMALVIGTIAVVAATYHQLIRRFPEGGGGARSVGVAFGDAWAFIPLGALLVDFVITVAISCAAGASAVIAYVPELEPERMLLALGLTALVAAGERGGAGRGLPLRRLGQAGPPLESAEAEMRGEAS